MSSGEGDHTMTLELGTAAGALCIDLVLPSGTRVQLDPWSAALLAQSLQRFAALAESMNGKELDARAN
jgi:hypothetical protein